MHVSCVEVERFMGLRKVALQLDAKMQIVAGPNNAGKTTLFKAFEFFFNPEGTDLNAVQPQNKYYASEGVRSLTRVKLYFGDLADEDKAAFAAGISKRRGDFWCEVRISRSGNVTYSAPKDADGAKFHEAICSRFQVVHVPAVRVQRTGGDQSEQYRLTATVQDVLVKTRPGRQTDLQKTFAARVADLTAVIQDVLDASRVNLTELGAESTGLSFAMPQEREVLSAVLAQIGLRTREGADLYLQDEGTGFQSLLSMGVLNFVGTAGLTARTRPLFLIEEPEAFLHPQYQRIVANRLIGLADTAQVVVTTHSPTIIDAVDIRSVCRLPRDTEGLSFTWEPGKLDDTQAGRLSRYCDAKNSELVFADKVILCEGPTE